jgi:hypothetical protein
MFGLFKKKAVESPKQAEPQTKNQTIPPFNTLNPSSSMSKSFGKEPDITPNLQLPEFPPLPDFKNNTQKTSAPNPNGLPSLPELPTFDSQGGLNSPPSSTKYDMSKFNADFDPEAAKTTIAASNDANKSSPFANPQSKSPFNLEEHAPELPEFDAEFEKELQALKPKENKEQIKSFDSKSQNKPTKIATEFPSVESSTAPAYVSQNKDIFVDIHKYQDVLVDINGVRNDIKHIHENSKLLDREALIDSLIEDMKKNALHSKSLVNTIDNTLFVK